MEVHNPIFYQIEINDLSEVLYQHANHPMQLFDLSVDELKLLRQKGIDWIWLVRKKNRGGGNHDQHATTTEEQVGVPKMDQKAALRQLKERLDQLDIRLMIDYSLYTMSAESILQAKAMTAENGGDSELHTGLNTNGANPSLEQELKKSIEVASGLCHGLAFNMRPSHVAHLKLNDGLNSWQSILQYAREAHPDFYMMALCDEKSCTEMYKAGFNYAVNDSPEFTFQSTILKKVKLHHKKDGRDEI